MTNYVYEHVSYTMFTGTYIREHVLNRQVNYHCMTFVSLLRHLFDF